MRFERFALVGVLVAPAAGAALAVWAEFADLGPPLLLAVACPAIVLATLSAARLRGATHPVAFMVVGAVLGAMTFGISGGGYVALHLSRGGELEFDAFDSQGAMAVAFVAIHLAGGALVGAVIGAVAYAARLVKKRGDAGTLKGSPTKGSFTSS